MKKIIYFLIAVALVGGAIWLLTKQKMEPVPGKVSSFETDTVLSGNQIINRGEKIIAKNSATLTVDGDLIIKGSVECENGSLNLVVKGDLIVDNGITCNLKDETLKSGDIGTAIALAVEGSAIFNDSALITANGHVQVVDSTAKLSRTTTELERIFDGVESDSGKPLRIGPFVKNGSSSVILSGAKESQEVATPATAAGARNDKSESVSLIIPTARAQAPEPCVDANGNVVPNCIRIGGKWVIGSGEAAPLGVNVSTPPKGVKKILINFDFGPNKDYRIEDFALSGPDGRAGADDINKSCNAKGGNGEDAFRVRIAAGNITIDDFELWLGHGGKGGNAETTKDCNPGNATGGNGGKPGNLKIEAVNSLTIAGDFIIHPGYGGNGGKATAYGRNGIDACPGQKGGDATARGGNGANNKKDLRALGSITGINNVSVSSTRGGDGGGAIANPGKGGSGTSCGCAGGAGGKGTAIGGKGGNANLLVLGTPVKTIGGNGGSADSKGGIGGNGGMCDARGPGGNGGNGGDAVSTKGTKGTGVTAGEDGRLVSQAGGNAGNGGDGCNEGQGGKGGIGNPNGKNGAPGRNLCQPPGGVTPEPQPESEPPREIIPTDLQGGGGNYQFYQ